MPESAYGPTNQCVGLGSALLKRGHRVVFAAEASWKGKLTGFGFEEDLVDLATPSDSGDQDPGQFWKDFIRDTSPEFRKPTIDQLETFIKPTWQALIDGSMYCEPQLREIIARVKPDVIVEDNVLTFPALLTSGAPFVRIVSCNPLEMKGEGVPPTFSGLPCDDQSQWGDFKKKYSTTHRAMWESFNAWVIEQGAPPLPDMEFIHTSEHANLYVYPQEIDYTDQRPLDQTWHRMDSSVRDTDGDFELPESMKNRPEGSALIYLSLGSLGSADADLMRRLVSILGKTRHRFIVSKGPQHASYELAENMYGAEFLAQIKIIPQVDLVITHGGNNTVVESMHFGKPMIVLPLFWDQYDNAQRIDETGFGVRLATYDFEDAEMVDAIDRLLNDHKLQDLLRETKARIQGNSGVKVGADVIESVGRKYRETQQSL
ncbi:MAG: glycosyl transferase [Streptomycetaceae bacterium]|nr:MAG: glycosyl transferase [Streptomycetaceae bacterium]